MQAWSQIDIVNVAGNGVLTQLFPENVTAGAGGSGYKERRMPSSGTLFRIDIVPQNSAGGTVEIWDLGGTWYDASNNVDTGTSITNAYAVAAKTNQGAKKIWEINFNGDDGLVTKTFATMVPFMNGLAARYINIAETLGTVAVGLNLVVQGGYRKQMGDIPS
jgi:hypothetical protein